MYTPYVSTEEYANLGFDLVPPSDLNKFLIKASRDIDTLTFNRIVGRFDDLTDFQKEIIKAVVCEQADFLYENNDALTSILSSYDINGVRMVFGGGAYASVENGVPIENATYSLLMQTGLCWRGAI